MSTISFLSLLFLLYCVDNMDFSLSSCLKDNAESYILCANQCSIILVLIPKEQRTSAVSNDVRFNPPDNSIEGKNNLQPLDTTRVVTVTSVFTHDGEIRSGLSFPPHTHKHTIYIYTHTYTPTHTNHNCMVASYILSSYIYVYVYVHVCVCVCIKTGQNV